MDKRLAIARELPSLRRFARALVGDPVEADDLVQDALERALSRIAQLRQPERPRSWLFAIMHNIYRDGLRTGSRRPRAASIQSVSHAELAEPARQPGLIEAGQVLEALATLPADRKSALVLVAVEGLSYREAAGVLGIPTGTLMSRLARGREQLREALEATPASRQSHLRSLK